MASLVVYSVAQWILYQRFGHRGTRSLADLSCGQFAHQLSCQRRSVTSASTSCVANAVLFRPENGIPIEGWTHDPSDEALLDLLPVLDSLRFTSDVRRVLGLRSAGGYL